LTARAIARQYAHALFDVAQKSRQTERIGREMADFVSLVASNEELSAVLTSAAIPPATKRAIVEALVRAAPDLSPELGRTLVLLADRDRLGSLDAIVAAYEQRVMETSRVTRAELATPAPLDDATRRRIAEALRQAVGGELMLTERVDPSLVGGFAARVGSVVFDGSVRRHLERLRERLLNEVS
jgi:F-type H+-transporting ATPase subunit delta